MRKQQKTVGIVMAAAASLGIGFLLTALPKATSASETPEQNQQHQTQVLPQANEVRPRIDVVFALDTTGSMSGMLAGAKDKIWSLANEIASGQPRPIVRFGLVGYRDRGDAYVTKVTGLSGDMDAMYDELMAFSADGGGDGPEHVNQALADSLDKMEWQQGDKVLRIVFLVGDAPPHDDYNDGLNSQALAKRAREKGILINTIRTGGDPQTGLAWEKIAALAGGQFHSISQNGGMVAVSTPYDDKLLELNRSLADTTVAYGSDESRRRMRSKIGNRYAMKAEVAASAASFSAKKPGSGLGRGDLLEELEAGDVTIDSLDDGQMGGEMRGMSKQQQKTFIAAKQAKRKEAQKSLKALSAERDAWIRKNSEKNKDGMDNRMMGAVKEQASGLGVAW